MTESEDETLLDAWVAGEDLDIDTVIADMEKAVVRGEFYPLIPINPARSSADSATAACTGSPPLAPTARYSRPVSRW